MVDLVVKGEVAKVVIVLVVLVAVAVVTVSVEVVLVAEESVFDGFR